MANEREVKLGLLEATCSVTGKRCKCGSSDSCRAHRTSVDNLPTELVRRIKTIHLRIDNARDAAIHAEDYDEQYRIWPQPELREARRLLDEAQRILERVLGG